MRSVNHLPPPQSLNLAFTSAFLQCLPRKAGSKIQHLRFRRALPGQNGGVHPLPTLCPRQQMTPAQSAQAFYRSGGKPPPKLQIDLRQFVGPEGGRAVWGYFWNVSTPQGRISQPESHGTLFPADCAKVKPYYWLRVVQRGFLLGF
jgi:hypothetical protein